MGVRCFYLEATGEAKEIAYIICHYCGAKSAVWERPMPDVDAEREDFDNIPWPPQCPNCNRDLDYEHETEYPVQTTYLSRAMRHAETGEVKPLEQWEAGAMWYVPEDFGYRTGPDGRALMVRLPDGSDWTPDGRAGNCDRPDDDEHRCWVRDGVPPNVTAGKEGNTCSAGAGSIQTPEWHGFLQSGELNG